MWPQRSWPNNVLNICPLLVDLTIPDLVLLPVHILFCLLVYCPLATRKLPAKNTRSDGISWDFTEWVSVVRWQCVCLKTPRWKHSLGRFLLNESRQPGDNARASNDWQAWSTASWQESMRTITFRRYIPPRPLKVACSQVESCLYVWDDWYLSIISGTRTVTICPTRVFKHYWKWLASWIPV